MKNVIVLIFSFFLIHFCVFSQGNDIQTVEISENLYTISGINGGNVAFLVTRKGVIVIDAGATPSDGQKIVDIIQKTTSKPIKYLILTHHHSDHIHGMVSFPDDVKIIAHTEFEKNNTLFNEEKIDNYIVNVLPSHLENIKLRMDSINNNESGEYKELQTNYNNSLNYLEELKKVKFRKPDILVEDYYFLKLGGERLMVEYPGPGHTNDNLVVKFSNHNVLHSGDLVFNKMFPYTIYEHGVDIYNWIVILDDLYKENILKVIPGHGEAGNKSILRDQSKYFKDLAKKVETLSKKGYELDQIIAEIKPSEFKLQGNEEQLPVNIEIIYTEIIKKGRDWWKF